ncbi:isoprenyl transferase [uncultured Ferrovibrio sp.]|jgi:undecaprenyl diphosphate synthase|uniref:isoprenyl transferase n=1 Tax=uncultured Ferrovibrio sp. TaxID=1576913 RepID=UPI00261532C2|nr:isoprenyl transferase [uncultured Ferrovibrio sp.]
MSQPIASPVLAPAPPRHVAIIMDGNGRWAKARGLPRNLGHRQGVDAVREVVRTCRRLGIEYLTLYAFSSENWKRPESEVNGLMELLRLYIRRELDELARNDVCIRMIGDRSRLAPDIVELITEAEAKTQNNHTLTLVIALSYGGQDEIVEACRRLAEQVAAGKLSPQDITTTSFANHLQTAGIPDPDMIIRTSGEQRLSNFLIWQSAYSELIFVDKLWPDFSSQDLAAAVEEFQRRERRYGGSGE